MSMIQINWNPDRRILRQFGFIALGVFGALAALVWFRHSFFGIHLSESAMRTTTGILTGIGVLSGLCAAVAPQAVKPLYVGLTAIGLPIGWAVSHLLLAILFYLVLTPVGLFFRLIGRDSLRRRFQPAATSYWERRPPTPDPKRYFRQF